MLVVQWSHSITGQAAFHSALMKRYPWLTRTYNYFIIPFAMFPNYKSIVINAKRKMNSALRRSYVAFSAGSA